MTKSHPTPHQNSNLAVISMILGIVSIVGFVGFILGIPAIIVGIIALKKGEAERGMSITGIVTGAISTFISLILLAVLVIVIIFAAADASTSDYSRPEHQTDYRLDDSTSHSNEI